MVPTGATFLFFANFAGFFYNTGMKHLAALRKYFWRYRLRLVVGLLFIVLSNYFGILAPQITGYIIHFVQANLPGGASAVRPENYDWFVRWFIGWVEQSNYSIGAVVAISGITILLLALLRGLFMFFMRQTIIVMSRHIEYDQKNDVYDHYQRLDLSFYKNNSVGDLMSRMAEDVSRVRQFTGPAIMYLINLVTLISLTVFFMWRRSPELTLYVLAPLPILAITIYVVNTIIHKKSEQLQASLAAITSNAQQSYSGIRVIKSFVQERAMLRFFSDRSEDYRKGAVTLSKIEAIYFPSMTLFIGISTLLTIMIGGLQYINGTGNIGLDTIVEFVVYINMLTFPVSAIGWTASMIQRAAASQKRLNEFLNLEPLIAEPKVPVTVTPTGDVVFQSVNFTYPQTGIKAVRNFSLHIKKGQRVAITGRTGSGKTTVAQLLLRMFDVDEGSIIMDGVNIKDISLHTLRSAISYVPQDGFLFSDTVANNIAFGLSKAEPEAIESAAKMAAVAADIEGFAKGYQTIVGERGVTLSGGQKQRVSIARGLVKESAFLVLDDSLSAVDLRTEYLIQNNIKTAMRNRTAIVITHKLSGVTDFDQIVVMEDGAIAEQGTHQELLHKSGIYAELWLAQQVGTEA